MSWYREHDGTIIVCEDCEHLIHEHIGFQMGTTRRSDGKLILLDPDLLSMCGKRKRRYPSNRKPPRSTHLIVCSDIIDDFISRDNNLEDCPMDKSKCRFYNDVFCVCVIEEYKDKVKNHCPCVKG